jgi:hypothetical protein
MLGSRNKEATMIELALHHVDFSYDTRVERGGRVFIRAFLGFHGDGFPGFAGVEPG